MPARVRVGAGIQGNIAQEAFDAAGSHVFYKVFPIYVRLLGLAVVGHERKRCLM